MIDWIKTGQGLAAIMAAIFATMVAWWNLCLPRVVFSPELAPIHARIEALEQFNRDTRLLVLDQVLVARQSAGMLWPETDAAFVMSGRGSGGGRAPRDSSAAGGHHRGGVESG